MTPVDLREKVRLVRVKHMDIDYSKRCDRYLPDVYFKRMPIFSF